MLREVTMDHTIITPKLKLILLTAAERGSREFEWLHELRSDEKATWWSLYGKAKSPEDTEEFIKACFPNDTSEKTVYRLAYTVHEQLPQPANEPIEGESPSQDQRDKSTRFVGLIALVPLDANTLPLPESLSLPPPSSTTTLTLEIAYHFLPTGWNKGYATESISAVFAACRSNPSFWSPYTNLYVRAIVNEKNPASLRVMQKTGMIDRGVYEWTGKAVFLAGEWTERSSLHICGRYLLE
ncbi:MAG: hypothetical protein LQ346_005317 [Caloplaca aetnensis]|nr:MAG: hypothetical protein LQ346_005317 [Caloplaca aetnensis]